MFELGLFPIAPWGPLAVPRIPAVRGPCSGSEPRRATLTHKIKELGMDDA